LILRPLPSHFFHQRSLSDLSNTQGTDMIDQQISDDLLDYENDQSTLFKNLNNSEKTEDENEKNFFLNVVDCVFGRLESFLVLLKHDYFNEVEAAMFLRLDSPQTVGRDTVRNYALRSKKLSFIKIGRTGLIFSRKDLEKFIESQRLECFRDLHY